MAQAVEQRSAYFKGLTSGKGDLGADQLIQVLEGIDKASFASNESDRVRVKEAARAALRRLQTPWDIAEEHGWQAILSLTTIKTLIDCGLWKKWVEAGGKASTTPELATLCGNIDAVLLKRLLRQLAGQHLIEEVGDGDTYALTDFSRSLGGTQYALLYDWFFALNLPCFPNFPKFAAETGYKNPTDPVHSAFAHWYGEGQTLFTMLAQKPELGHVFANMMHLYTDAKPPWVDVYPTERILEGAKPGRALVVDLGGGVGYDIEKMRAKHPDVPAGSLILEDVSNVLENAKIQAPVVTQECDLFKPQPVIGARVYYLHAVTHNWPDAKVVEILKNIAMAMEKGYSKILLYDMVIVKKNPHPRMPTSDLVMMMSLPSASERTEDTWYQIAKDAGLTVAKIWSAPEAVESIIELEL